MNMEFLYEIRLGFYSEYWFNCKMCNIKQKIQSVKNSPTTDWSINKSVVNSTIAIGEYYGKILKSKLLIIEKPSLTFSILSYKIVY